MKKVVFITEGGRKIGFGHVTRCVSLYQAFEEEKIMPMFIVNGDNSILEFLKNADYKMFDWLKEGKKLFESLKDADIIVIDSYLAGKSLYNKIYKVCRNLVMIDDYKRIKYPRGIIINPSIYGGRINYPGKAGAICLTGENYIILRKEFWALPRKNINKKLKNVLITFGGMNHADLNEKVINYLRREFDFTFNVVKTEKNKAYPRKMFDLMLDADICISGGGQTIHELARVGVPTIGICLSENQRMNLESWHEKRFIKYAGWHNDKNLLRNIESAIEDLSAQKIRLKISSIGRRFIDGQGARRIVKEVLTHYADKN